jgi:hypothetical protein
MLSFCHRTVKFVFPSSPQKIARNMGLHAHCGLLQIVRRSTTIPLPEPSSLTNL